MDSLKRNLNTNLVLDAIDTKINQLKEKRENYLRENESDVIDPKTLEADEMNLAKMEEMIAKRNEENDAFIKYMTERIDKAVERLEHEKSSFLELVNEKEENDKAISELTQKREEVLQSERRKSLLKDKEQCMKAMEEEKGKYISESRGTYFITDSFTFKPTKIMQEYEADLAKINSELETLDIEAENYAKEIDSVQSRNTELSDLINHVFEKYHIEVKPELQESEQETELTSEEIQKQEEEAWKLHEEKGWENVDEAVVSEEIEKAYLEKEQAEAETEAQQEADTKSEKEEFKNSQENPQPSPTKSNSAKPSQVATNPTKSEPSKITFENPETPRVEKNPFQDTVRIPISTNIKVVLGNDSIVYETMKELSKSLPENLQEDKINLDYSDEYIQEKRDLLKSSPLKQNISGIENAIDPNIVESLLKEKVNDTGIDDYIAILRGNKNMATTIEYDFRGIYDSKFNIEEIRKINKIAKAARKLNKNAISIQRDNIAKRFWGNLKKRMEYLFTNETKMLGKGLPENETQNTEENSSNKTSREQKRYAIKEHKFVQKVPVDHNKAIEATQSKKNSEPDKIDDLMALSFPNSNDDKNERGQ